MKPVVDNTTQDWFLVQGKEENGWTAIKFRRYFDSCDPMDVPIRVKMFNRIVALSILLSFDEIVWYKYPYICLWSLRY